MKVPAVCTNFHNRSVPPFTLFSFLSLSVAFQRTANRFPLEYHCYKSYLCTTPFLFSAVTAQRLRVPIAYQNFVKLFLATVFDRLFHLPVPSCSSVYRNSVEFPYTPTVGCLLSIPCFDDPPFSGSRLPVVRNHLFSYPPCQSFFFRRIPTTLCRPLSAICYVCIGISPVFM